MQDQESSHSAIIMQMFVLRDTTQM